MELIIRNLVSIRIKAERIIYRKDGDGYTIACIGVFDTAGLSGSSENYLHHGATSIHLVDSSEVLDGNRLRIIRREDSFVIRLSTITRKDDEAVVITDEDDFTPPIPLRKKILIDTDGGIDDSFAILMMLLRNDVEVVGITTCSGDVDSVTAASNILALLRLLPVKKEIPVVCGASTSIEGIPQMDHIAKNGEYVKPAPGLPVSGNTPVAENVEDFIAGLTHKYGKELTIITLGTLTNIALSVKKDQELPKLLGALYVMGGTIFEKGNAGPVTEGNIAGDVRAAELVFSAGFNLTMVGLDATSKVRINRKDLEDVRKYGKIEMEGVYSFVDGLYSRYALYQRKRFGFLDEVPLNNSLACIAAVDPSVLVLKEYPVLIECSHGITRGMTIADRRFLKSSRPLVKIAFDVDVEEAKSRILTSFL